MTLYVVRMHPRHREGWLFVAVGFIHAVMFFGRQYGRAEWQSCSSCASNTCG